MAKTISLRLDEERYKVLEMLSEEHDKTKSEALKEIIDCGRIDIAIRFYRENKVSLEKASTIAGISMGEFMDEMRLRGVELNVTLDDFKESLKHVRELLKGKK